MNQDPNTYTPFENLNWFMDLMCRLPTIAEPILDSTPELTTFNETKCGWSN